MDFSKDFDHPVYIRELASTAGKQSGAIAVALGPVTKDNVHLRAAALLHEAVDILGSFPGTELDSRLWGQLSCYTSQLDTTLAVRLHFLEKHPDFEYTTEEGPYKNAGDWRKPEGFGWKVNEHHYGGCTRDEPTETYYYMRHKDDALKDQVKVQDMRPATIPPLRLYEWLTMLAGQYPVSQFPGSMPFGFNPNTEALSDKDRFIDQFLRLPRPSGERVTRVVQENFLSMLAKDAVNVTFKISKVADHFVDGDLKIGEYSSVVPGELLHYTEVDSGEHTVGILTSLTDTFGMAPHNHTRVWYRITRKDKNWGEFESFYEFTKLPVNKYALADIIVG